MYVIFLIYYTETIYVKQVCRFDRYDISIKATDSEDFDRCLQIRNYLISL